MYIQKLKGDAFFYFPNFCVVEVFNAFARWRYRENKINDKAYKDYLGGFKGEIRNRKNLYCYNLHRYHNYNADLIYQAEHTIRPLDPLVDNAPKSKCSLSGLDILVIAMGMELKRIHPKDQVYVVTNDERMAKVANSDPAQYVPAIYLEKTDPKNLPK